MLALKFVNTCLEIGWCMALRALQKAAGEMRDGQLWEVIGSLRTTGSN